MAKVKKRKEKKTVYDGQVYIQATFNNTIVTITDMATETEVWEEVYAKAVKGEE